MGYYKMTITGRILTSLCLAASVAISPLSFAYEGQYSQYNQGGAQQAQNNQPETAAQQKEVNKAAFKSLLKQYFPLSTKQVHEFKNASAAQKEANARPAGPAPAKSTSNIIPVTFKPGHVMPIVRIGSGMVSSLVFTDKSGKVWPITSYTLGDPAAFGVSWNKKSGVLMVQGKKLFGQSNVAVMLSGMKVPVMITLVLGQSKWDYLDYIQIQKYMPSDQGISTPKIAQAPSYLTSVLNGVPPSGAKALRTTGSLGTSVWEYNGKYLMLTQSTLLSPGFVSRADGPNGYHAYELQAAPYVILSNHGKIQRLMIAPTGNASPSAISTETSAPAPASTPNMGGL